MDILPQLLLNGIVIGFTYGLIAVGLSLYYGILGFINFAHGDIATVGAYSLLFFRIFLDWPLIPSITASLAVVTMLGLLIEKICFRPVQDAPQLTPLLISIGISLFIQAGILLAFGSNVYSLYKNTGVSAVHTLPGQTIITTNQLIIICATILIFPALFIFLKKTKTGKSIRAVSDNKTMAKIIGIRTNRIIALIFALSSAMAAIAGILIGYEQNLQANMGLALSVKAFAAVVLGGVGNIWGAIIGGLIIGLAENLLIGIQIGDFSIPSSFKDAVGFIVFLLVIFFRPYGLLGSKTEAGK